jgi:xylan 1,4-beta-xylosidase
MNEVNAETKLGRVSLAPGWPGDNASFHGGFGLVNAFGVPKPSYRAYQLLHRLGDAQLRVQRTSAPAPQDETATGLGPDELCAITTGVIATTNRSSTGSTRLLLYNHREWDAPQLGHPSPSVTCEITLTFSSNSGSDLPHSATTRTIDAAEANPRAKWIELGMPGYPSPDEHTQILAASELVPRTVPLQQQPTRDDTVRREATLTLTVGKHAVIAVDIDVNV